VDEIQRVEDSYGAKVYAKKPVAIVRGSGALVYDAEGKEYVDCAGGYGTCIVGHSHPKVVAAISEQATKLISCHGSTYNDARANLFTKLKSITLDDLDRFFLSNSGAEATECAIKISRKFTSRRKIIAFKGGFHGKTHGALSATWDAKYRKSFEPLLPDFEHLTYGDVEGAKIGIAKDTAAVLVEPIQGEGGIRVAPREWLGLVSDLAHDAGALLVADEIQSGFGRTGKMFASEHYGVQPDVLCIGKGIASGLPMSVTATDTEKMGSLRVGEHTTTFGGSPVVCAAAAATIDVLHEEHLVENAVKVGKYFTNQLLDARKQLRIMREVRGMGLMIGVEMRFDVYPILISALGEGILMLDAGRNVLRFLPPLVLDESKVDRVVAGLRNVMEKEQLAKLPS
jgi:acetylornithine/LysW-gamma-L-lysine aminotransferase